MVHSVVLSNDVREVLVRIERADDLVGVLVNGEHLDSARQVNSTPIQKDVRIPLSNTGITRVTIVGVNFGGNFHPFGYLVVDGSRVEPSFGNRDHFEHNVPEGIRNVAEYWLFRGGSSLQPPKGLITCAAWQSSPIKPTKEGKYVTYSCFLELCQASGAHEYNGNFYIDGKFGRLIEFDCQTMQNDARDELEFVTLKIEPLATGDRHQVLVRYRNRGLRPPLNGSVIAQPKLFFVPA